MRYVTVNVDIDIKAESEEAAEELVTTELEKVFQGEHTILRVEDKGEADD